MEAGLPAEKILSVLQNSVVACPAIRTKGPDMLGERVFTPNFPLKHAHKDLRLAVETGEGGGDPDAGHESRVRPVRRGAGQGVRRPGHLRRRSCIDRSVAPLRKRLCGSASRVRPARDVRPFEPRPDPPVPGIDLHRHPVLADPLVEPPTAAVGGGEVPRAAAFHGSSPRPGAPPRSPRRTAPSRPGECSSCPGRPPSPGRGRARGDTSRPPRRDAPSSAGDPRVIVHVGQPGVEAPRLVVQPERVLLPPLPGVPRPQRLQEHAEHLGGGKRMEIRPRGRDPELPPVPVVLPGGAAVRELDVHADAVSFVPDETVGRDVHPTERDAEPIREGEVEQRQSEAVPFLRARTDSKR